MSSYYQLYSDEEFIGDSVAAAEDREHFWQGYDSVIFAIDCSRGNASASAFFRAKFCAESTK